MADDLKVRAPASTVVGDKYGPIGEDIEFIAHAREDIPKLIAEIRRLRAMDDGDRQYEEGLRLLCEPKTEK